MAKNNSLGLLLLLGLGYFILSKKNGKKEIIATSPAGYAYWTNGGTTAYQPVKQSYSTEEQTGVTRNGRKRVRKVMRPTKEAILAGELAREAYQESVFDALSV